MKKTKALKNAHTPNTKFGMGDHYGQGIKQKVGRMREDMINNTQALSKKTKNPPRTLA
jgi:hypothetical protein